MSPVYHRLDNTLSLSGKIRPSWQKNYPADQLSAMPDPGGEIELGELRRMYICGTCNNLSLGSALESMDKDMMVQILQTAHAKHHIFWVGETEYYKNAQVEPNANSANSIIFGRKILLANNNVYLSPSVSTPGVD